MTNLHACINDHSFNWIDELGCLHSIIYNEKLENKVITSLNYSSFTDIPNCKSVLSTNDKSIALLENGEIIIRSDYKYLTNDKLIEIGFVVDICVTMSYIGILNSLGTLYILSYKRMDAFQVYYDVYYAVTSIKSDNYLNYIVFNMEEFTLVYFHDKVFTCNNLYNTIILQYTNFIGYSSQNLTFIVTIGSEKLTETLVKLNYSFTENVRCLDDIYLIDLDVINKMSIRSINSLDINFNKHGKCWNDCGNIIYLNNEGKLVCDELIKGYIECKDSTKFDEIDYYDVGIAIILGVSAPNYLLIKLISTDEFKIFKAFEEATTIVLPADFTLFENFGSYI